MTRTKAYLICMVVCCLCFKLTGQLNITVGYDLSITPLEKYNSVITARNNSRTYTDNLKKINLLSGLQIGAKYKTESTTFYLNINGTIKKTEGDWETVDNEVFTDIIKNRFLYGSFGLAGNFGILSIGSTIDYNLNQAKLEFEGQINSKNQFNGWSNKVFLNIEIPGADNVSLSIQPYAKFYWDKWDLSDFERDVLGTNVLPDANQSLMTYGLTIIFNNGPQ